jgi:hypothetical protein
MKYLITGATGDVGAQVVRQLMTRNIRPRILVRNAEKAHALFRQAAEIYVGDLRDPATTRSAIKGVHTLFLVNVGPEIPQRDEVAAIIAREEGVRRIVKLSSLDVEQGLAIGAWHEKGEAAIRASGVAFTFVRPTGFMTNLLAWAHSIKTEGVVRSSTETAAGLLSIPTISRPFLWQPCSMRRTRAECFLLPDPNRCPSLMLLRSLATPSATHCCTRPSPTERQPSATPDSAVLLRRPKLTFPCGARSVKDVSPQPPMESNRSWDGCPFLSSSGLERMLTTSSQQTSEFSSTSLLGMQPLWPELKTMPEHTPSRRKRCASASSKGCDPIPYQQPHVAELNGYLTYILLYGNMAIWTSMYRVTT